MIHFMFLNRDDMPAVEEVGPHWAGRESTELGRVTWRFGMNGQCLSAEDGCAPEHVVKSLLASGGPANFEFIR
jgi:hypothetical protein